MSTPHLTLLRRAPVLAVLFTLLLAVPVRAGGVIVEPSQVTQGTAVIISGSGFDGGLAPKVFAVTEGFKKRMAFTVVSHTDSVVSAQVKAVPSSKKLPAAGRSWSLMIEPRGAAAGPMIEAGSIMTIAPQVVQVATGGHAPGETFVVQVRDAGTSKLRVTINGRKSKVVSSAPSKGAGGSLDLRDVEVRVPNTHDGFFDVIVGNKLGINPSDQMVQVAGSSRPLPKDGLVAVVGGKKLRGKGEQLEVHVVEGEVFLNVQKGKSLIRQLVLTLPFDVTLENPPLRFTGKPAAIGYGEIHSNGQAPGWSTTSGTLEMLVNSKVGGRFHVTFKALLVEEGVQGEPSTRAVKGTVVFTGQSS
jgi:hypothetical protein